MASGAGYILAQVLGSIVGSLAIVGLLGKRASGVGLGVASYNDASVPLQAFFGEFIGTVLLVFAVFGVFHREAAPGWAGRLIGIVVFAANIPVATATEASINPARTTGPMLVQQILGGQVAWQQWPVYVGAELFAGILAVLLHGFVAKTQFDSQELVKEEEVRV